MSKDAEKLIKTIEVHGGQSKKNYSKALSRIGEKHVNCNGYAYQIIGVVHYVNPSKCHKYLLKIRFESGHKANAFSPAIITGKIKDMLSPSVCGKGIVGYVDKNKYKKEYLVWVRMLQRCYGVNNNAYKDYGGRGVVVCKEWLTLENFIKDIKALPNYDKWVSNCQYSIDKDYLVEGNLIYFPKACSFQPKYIQSTYQRKNSGKNIGVSGVRCITWDKTKQAWAVRVYKAGAIVKRATRIHLDDAKELLKTFLLKYNPEHPHLRQEKNKIFL